MHLGRCFSESRIFYHLNKNIYKDVCDKYKQCLNYIYTKNYKGIYEDFFKKITVTELDPINNYISFVKKKKKNTYTSIDNLQNIDNIDPIKEQTLIKFAKNYLKILNEYRNLIIDEGISLGIVSFDINETNKVNNVIKLECNNNKFKCVHACIHVAHSIVPLGQIPFVK